MIGADVNIFQDLHEIRNIVHVEYLLLDDTLVDELSQKSKLTFLELPRRRVNKDSELLVPFLDRDYRVLHQQDVQIHVKEIHFFHLEENFDKKSLAQILKRISIDNQFEDFKH